MKAAIYMRTCRQDKAHQAYTLAKQEQHTRDLATRHGLRVAFENVYCDIDHAGDLPPDCWTGFNYQGVTRPALTALIHAIEEGDIQHLIVRRMDRLGTSSDILINLLQFFTQYGVQIIATPESSTTAHDPSEAFAISILGPLIRYDTEDERERKQKLRSRKIEEIERLKDKILRLEAEIKELDI
ncbi:MAG: recombinase family protein [Kiritimatiellia bacterium]